MTIVVPFKEGTVPGLQPQGGFLRELEGLVASDLRGNSG